MNWVETLNGAIDYIEDNLLEEMSLLQVASYVNTSSAHLQRGFSALAGITIGEYIRNRRLSLAGFDLTHKDMKVIDAAVKYGYETSDGFSKAFRRFHGIAPSTVKNNKADLKSYSRLSIKIIMEGGAVLEYRIEEREAFEVVVKTKRIEVEEGDSTQIPAFWDEYFQRGLPEPTLGICGEVSEDSKSFSYGIGCFKEDMKEVPEGFEVLQVPENTWAVFTSQVGVENVQGMWRRIYSEWLPQAKYEILPSYDFEYYINIGETSAGGECQMMCEIWLPVKKKRGGNS